MHAMVFEQQIFFIGLGLPHIDDTCGLILGFFPRYFSWGAVLPLSSGLAWNELDPTLIFQDT